MREICCVSLVLTLAQPMEGPNRIDAMETEAVHPVIRGCQHRDVLRSLRISPCKSYLLAASREQTSPRHYHGVTFFWNWPTRFSYRPRHAGCHLVEAPTEMFHGIPLN